MFHSSLIRPRGLDKIQNRDTHPHIERNAMLDREGFAREANRQPCAGLLSVTRADECNAGASYSARKTHGATAAAQNDHEGDHRKECIKGDP